MPGMPLAGMFLQCTTGTSATHREVSNMRQHVRMVPGWMQKPWANFCIASGRTSCALADACR
jgi:hypothetical protein